MTKEREILARGFDHLSSIANALKKIQEEGKDDAETMQKALPLSMVFRALNDVLHPLYPDAQGLFPGTDLTEFIKGLNEAHQEAVEKNIFPPCICSVCKTIEALEVTDESATRNTDQAQ